MYPGHVSVTCNVSIPPIVHTTKIAESTADALDLSPSKPSATFVATLKIWVKRPPILFGSRSDILKDVSFCAGCYSTLWSRPNHDATK